MLTTETPSPPAATRGLGLHGLMTVLSLAMIAPFAWMMLASLKTLAEAGDPAWLPRAAQWDNYREVFRVIPFLRFMANSLVVAGWVTLLQVFTSSLAAFSFARLDWPGRDRVFFLYLGTMMLPGLVMVIPNYEIMVRFGLVDSYLGLVLPSAFSAFGTFLLRQFMLGIPRALDEAIENIASVSEENSASVEEVSASTEEVASQVEGVSASAEAMMEIAETLQKIVAQFKLN